MNIYFSLVRSFVYLLLITYLTIMSGQVYAADYYISKSGHDSNIGTLEEPWNTLSKANSTLTAGDTVFIRDGEYQEIIRPSRSGSKDSYITYAGYLDENPVFTNVSGGVAIDLSDRSYIKIESLKVEGKKLPPNANLKKWVTIINGHYNIIQNTTMQYANGYEGILLRGSTYNKILNNVLDGVGTLEGTVADLMGIVWGSHHNLIEGNTFSRGGHSLLQVRESSFNVIRNNYFSNQWTADTGYRAVSLVAESGKEGWNLFEDNILVNGQNSRLSQPNGLKAAVMKAQGRNQIVRRNIIFNSPGAAIKCEARDRATTIETKIYNNTFYHNGGPVLQLLEYSDHTFPITDVRFKNNILYENRLAPESSGQDHDIRLNIPDTIGGNEFVSNAIMKSAPGDAKVQLDFRSLSSVLVSAAESIYPAIFLNNIQVDPQFIVSDPEKREDFKLSSNSPLIDAGASLTTTTSSGTGNTITVDDAGYFTDGFEVIGGDLIQVGNNKPVRIIKVDYSLNKIAVDENIVWNNGDDVNLQFTGSGPDIGAIEYDSSTSKPKPVPPLNLKVNII